MSTVVITVRGQAESRTAPEIATLHVSVEFDGTERAGVTERALRLGESIRGEIEQLVSSGAVSEWSSDQLSVW